MVLPDRPPDRFTLWNQRIRDLCETAKSVLSTIAYAVYVALLVLAALGRLPADFHDALATLIQTVGSLSTSEGSLKSATLLSLSLVPWLNSPVMASDALGPTADHRPK
jgi:hypothetical protein